MKTGVFVRICVLILGSVAGCAGIPATPQRYVSTPPPIEMPPPEPAGQARQTPAEPAGQPRAGRELVARADAARYGSSADPEPTAVLLALERLDDNQAYEDFVRYVAAFPQAAAIDLPFRGRVIMEISDSRGRALPNLLVQFFHGRRVVSEGLTSRTGVYHFYPQDFPAAIREYPFWVKTSRDELKGVLVRGGPARVSYAFRFPVEIPPPESTDIAFIIDPALPAELRKQFLGLIGSLRARFDDTRFAVVSAAAGEPAVVRSLPFSADMEALRSVIEFTAERGDLQAALAATLNGLDWKADTRLSFMVSSANGYEGPSGHTLSLAGAARAARRKGVELFGLLPPDSSPMTEYAMRRLSQFTLGAVLRFSMSRDQEGEHLADALASLIDADPALAFR